jgi:hypothetical protein
MLSAQLNLNPPQFQVPLVFVMTLVNKRMIFRGKTADWLQGNAAIEDVYRSPNAIISHLQCPVLEILVLRPLCRFHPICRTGKDLQIFRRYFKRANDHVHNAFRGL